MSPRKPASGEVILTRGDELWWRQCPDTADCWDDDAGKPSGLMFRWDESGELSGARQDSTTAEASYKHRVEVEKRGSRGTWAVDVQTVINMKMQLVDDSANLPEPPESPPGHTYFDARDVSTGSSRAAKTERERIRSRLLRAANKLGRQFPAEEEPGTVTELAPPDDGGPSEAESADELETLEEQERAS